jgi:hypothetical protein
MSHFPARGKGKNVLEKLFVLGISNKSLFTQSSAMYFEKVLNFALMGFFRQPSKSLLAILKICWS